MSGTRSYVHGFLRANQRHLVDELIAWARLRSIAGVPEHQADLRRSANWLAAAFRATGFPVVEVWPAQGAPAVYAQWCAAPQAPTVLVYGHHDVPAATDEDWAQTAPFEPLLRDGHVYGRGTSDAKGQLLSQLWGVRAHLAATGRPAPEVNLKFLVEGAEATGPVHLARLVRENRDLLAADLIVFTGTLLWRSDHPAVCTSVRGLLSARLTVHGPLLDVDSAVVSGSVSNPAVELSKLLARLHDDKGQVTLPGFYDAVAEPTEHRRAELAALPFTEQDWLARTRTRAVTGEVGFTVLEQLWTRPAAEVLSLRCGDPSGTAVPAVAAADLSIRTVPGQRVADVADQLRRWVAETISDNVEYTLTVADATAQDAYETPVDLPALAALSAAMQDGFGKPAGRMGCAGSSPAELLSRILEAPVLFFGVGLPEDRRRDSDERVLLQVLINGAATLAYLWRRLAGTGLVRRGDDQPASDPEPAGDPQQPSD